MVAGRGRASLRALLDELYAQVGTILSRRIDFTLRPEERARLITKLEEPPAELIGRRITAVERKDGTKLLLEDGSWLLIRLSGTEPVVRLYVEAKNAKDLERLIEASQKLVYSA
jgi:phosphoglucomutase